jgi:hypothetical protein
LFLPAAFATVFSLKRIKTQGSILLLLDRCRRAGRGEEVPWQKEFAA